MNTRAGLRLDVIICVILVLASLTIYWQTKHCPFINYDDNLYVTENFHTQKGVSLENLKWAIHATDAFNWHPLTWLSHMMDIELFGLNAGGHHLTNLLFHMADALLLFVLLKSMTGAPWPSAFAAALFALHPLHVESVVWISERKDVLSTFFGLLALISYMRYAQKGSRSDYMLALLFFIFGLMAKPMLVTLPFVMLLLDYWPLGRVKFDAAFRPRPSGQTSSVFSLLLEKIPFFMLTAASCVVTYYAQQGGGAVMTFSRLPLAMRMENAIVSYVGYIGKMIWPAKLAVFYPYMDSVAVWKLVVAAAVLLGVFILVIVQIRRRPYLAVGWLWYFGTLVPVIGLVQVGSQAMADRYTYVPMIGLFIMIAWGGAEIIGRWRLKPVWVALAAGILLLSLIVTSRTQVGHWANSITLYSHTLRVTENNFRMHNNLALALAEAGRYEKSLFHMREALKQRPNNPDYINNLGDVLMEQGRYEEAIRHFERAIKLDPKKWRAHQNLATALMWTGQANEAISHYHIALDLSPHNKKVLNDLANAMVRQGRIMDAIPFYSKALSRDPNDPEIHNNYGVALIQIGRFKKAVIHFRKALQLKPDYTAASENLKRAFKLQP